MLSTLLSPFYNPVVYLWDCLLSVVWLARIGRLKKSKSQVEWLEAENSRLQQDVARLDSELREVKKDKLIHAKYAEDMAYLLFGEDEIGRYEDGNNPLERAIELLKSQRNEDYE